MQCLLISANFNSPLHQTAVSQCTLLLIAWKLQLYGLALQPIVPWFLCDLWFYLCVYVFPIVVVVMAMLAVLALMGVVAIAEDLKRR